MAHFAKLDDNNVVLQVIVVADEHEQNGEQWCHEFAGGRWKQTSRSGRICKNFAGKGFSYDEQRDAFIPPRPFPSWTLNEETCQWQPPNPRPNDDYKYRWSELLSAWIATNKYLFDDYGLTQDYSLIAPAVEKYGLENKKLVKVIDKPEYVFYLEKANNILFIHNQVPTWTAEVKKLLQVDFDLLHKELGTDIYAYSFTTNAEYLANHLQSAADLKKFAQLFGFEEYEDVVLGDGYEHWILKRPLSAAYDQT
jgi:hypothetical protein